MLETAIILPFFLLLLVGILEFGRAVMIHQISTNAAREAARLAVVPGMQSANVQNICNDYLDSASIKQTGRVVEIRDSSGANVDLGKIQSHESVTIYIEIPYAENTWGLTTWLVGKTLRSEVTMRRE